MCIAAGYFSMAKVTKRKNKIETSRFIFKFVSKPTIKQLNIGQDILEELTDSKLGSQNAKSQVTQQ